jgi:predicted nuclease with TOPRIM domain
MDDSVSKLSDSVSKLRMTHGSSEVQEAYENTISDLRRQLQASNDNNQHLRIEVQTLEEQRRNSEQKIQRLEEEQIILEQTIRQLETAMYEMQSHFNSSMDTLQVTYNRTLKTTKQELETIQETLTLALYPYKQEKETSRSQQATNAHLESIVHQIN